MEPKKEKVFGAGLIFKRPRDGAPAFVKGSVSVKVEEFIPFLQKYNKDGWVNLTLKESQGGKLYFELDTWTKTISKNSDIDTSDTSPADISGIPF